MNNYYPETGYGPTGNPYESGYERAVDPYEEFMRRLGLGTLSSSYQWWSGMGSDDWYPK